MFSGRARARLALEPGAGVTLIEVMISSAITLLLMSSLAYVLWCSFSHSQRIDARLELNNQTLTALSHLKREIAESSLACVEVDEAETLVFPSPRTAAGVFDNSSGGLRYHKMICYRKALMDGDQRLLRQEEILTPSTTPLEPGGLTPPRDRGYFEGSAFAPRVIARGLTCFEVRRDITTGTLIGGRIHIALGLERAVRGRTYGVEVETAVTPLN